MCLPDLFLRHAHEHKWSGLPAILAGNGRRFAELPGTPHVGWTDPAPSPWIPDALLCTHIKRWRRSWDSKRRFVAIRSNRETKRNREPRGHSKYQYTSRAQVFSYRPSRPLRVASASARLDCLLARITVACFSVVSNAWSANKSAW